jgi:hypothetical protein
MLDQRDLELFHAPGWLAGALLGTIPGTEVGIKQNAGGEANQGKAKRKALNVLKHSMPRTLVCGNAVG